MRLPLACVLLVGGMIGFAIPADPVANPAGDDGADNSASAGDAAKLANLNGADASERWTDDVQLDREPDGHFYADVVVDGVPTRMLVDTGASVIALTGQDALAMGLFWDEADIAPVARGASGAVYGVNTTLSRVRVGDFEAENVQAMIIPEGLAISLLGQSFLSTIDSVAIADNRMILTNGSESPAR